MISDEVRGKLLRILAPDYKVYDYFKSKFDDRLEAFGSGRMEEEMGELRKVNEAVLKKWLVLYESFYLLFSIFPVISPRLTTARSPE